MKKEKLEFTLDPRNVVKNVLIWNFLLPIGILALLWGTLLFPDIKAFTVNDMIRLSIVAVLLVAIKGLWDKYPYHLTWDGELLEIRILTLFFRKKTLELDSNEFARIALQRRKFGFLFTILEIEFKDGSSKNLKLFLPDDRRDELTRFLGYSPEFVDHLAKDEQADRS